jgi:hypothetical protein
VRYRGNITVYGRAISFVLPSELVTESDVAYLEGHGEAPGDVTAAGPNLPLSCPMTVERQQELVAAGTAVVVRSADFLMPWLVAPLLIGVPALVGSLPATAIAVAFAALLTLPGLRGVARTRRGIRRGYPVGRTVRAEATAEHLVLSLPHSTRTMAWSEFSGIRVTQVAVLLRRTRPPLGADSTVVLPLDLFDADALAAASAAVSGPVRRRRSA